MILPILAAALVGSLIYHFHWIFIVFLVVLLIRICCMNNRRLLAATVLCSFFVGIRTYTYLQSFQPPPEKVEAEVLQVLEDTVKVEGNSLRFSAKNESGKYRVYYRLKTQEEQQVWLQEKLPDHVLLNGTFVVADPARNLHGYDARQNDLSLGITGIMQADSLKVKRVGGFSLSKLRAYLIFHTRQVFPKRLASYLNALVVGHKDENFEEYTEGYQLSGLLHLFTLSGLHIQFYLGGLQLLLTRCGLVRESRLAILTLVGVSLIFLCGGGASVLRAVLSYLIAFICLTFDWQLSGLDRWGIMLLALLLIRPLVFYSIGGRLSLFFAFLLLYLSYLSDNRWLQSLLFPFLAFPLLLYEFSEWSIVAGVFTLLLMPVFSWIVLPGCLLLFFMSFLVTPPAFLLSMLETVFIILEKALLVGTIPSFVIGEPAFLLLFGLIILVMVLIHRRKRREGVLQLALLILCLIVSIPFSSRGLVAFVDVGQGDSIFIKLPFHGETFLIDTGGRLAFKQEDWQRRKNKPPSDYNILPFIKGEGYQTIDHLIITHNDADHMGELLNVTENFRVKNLYLGEGSEQDIVSILKQIKPRPKIHLVKEGDVIGKKLKLHVLSPKISDGSNNNSLVTYFSIKEKSFLLTGDLEKEGEEDLIQRYPQLQVDVLKIGHHGSKTSTSPAFVQQLQPESVVISAGKNNRYGHPAPETLATLEEAETTIYRTDQQGMIYYEWRPFWQAEKLKPRIAFLE
ncbi:DNA internalization-related competence protein ComEC/Rec2 [Enterococcus sp. 669A]|uniref:DNA internalization-related competence protein ComEC/Rec2 n=2 Tax=Candidatus Enterococcus moelleringii TaxID=2815325 RepID=A0ABS3LDC9_9ENTE|nr:DNA internalization-related competence protein ComEC/Rec2 [Enterococcus sp. 669A]